MVMKLKLFKWFIFFIIFFTNILSASEKKINNVKWRLSPVRPVQNTNFEFTVSFNYLGNYKPNLSFELDGCELIKKNRKIEEKTNKIIDGKFVTIKKMKYKFTFKTKSAGKFFIRKFKIQAKDTRENISPISFFVDKVFKKKLDFHFIGEVSKRSFFQGEGFNVDYYLYFKDYVLDTNILKFPKLNGFFKRYKKITGVKDEVSQYKGAVYNRRLIYSARLFPTNSGENYIDSMELSVDIPETSKNGFNSYLNSSRVKKIKLISPQVKIKVKQIPIFVKGPGFINLVGNHKFSLKMLQGSNIVNDPIRLLLQVEGKGFLEEMVPPELYKIKGVEVFNIKTDISLSPDKSKGIKQFVYTIIGKEKITISERKKIFSTFDSSTLTIKSQQLILPSLSFVKSNFGNNIKERSPSSVDKNIKKILFQDKYLAPQFTPEQHFVGESNILNIVLGIILLFVILDLIYKKKSSRKKELDSNLKKILKESKRGKLNYSRLFQLIQSLKKEDSMVNNISPRDIINTCNLKLESKRYFANLLDVLENDAFGKVGGKKRFKYERKCFKDLKKNLYK